MQRRVFLLLALMLAVPAVAKASTISASAPVVELQPGLGGQTLTLFISGNDFYQFGDFFAN